MLNDKLRNAGYKKELDEIAAVLAFTRLYRGRELGFLRRY